VKQSGTEGLTCVSRYHSASAILVAQEMVAAFDTEDAETRFRERGQWSVPVMHGLRLMPR
jgi:hypothetical protein